MVLLCFALGCGPSVVDPEDDQYGRICGDGDEFAASVLAYDPSYLGAPAPTNENYTNPDAALGPPDYDHDSQFGAVSLGSGGLLELGFDGCLLGLSGDSSPDLRIYEAGPFLERSFLSVRLTLDAHEPAGAIIEVPDDGYLDLGRVEGGVVDVDLDGRLPLLSSMDASFIAFDAIRILDDPEQGGWGPGGTTGADIDAVEILTPAEPQ
jgi:hypothetical protein